MNPLMVSHTVAHSSASLPPNVRPTDPSRDLGAVAFIIEVAFAEELVPGAGAITRELRWLGSLGPLVRFVSIAIPGVVDVLGGYVWEENGQVVGNINVAASDYGNRHWVISNVAVLPAYRRHGIARALMDAALEHARMRGASRISLQVRNDNAGARHLYETLGFRTIDTNTELYAEYIQRADLPVPASEDVMITPPDHGRWYEAYEVARAAIPGYVQQLRPLRPAAFRHRQRSWWEQMWDYFWGSPRERWWAEYEGRTVGLLTIERRVNGFGAQIELLIHPQFVGKVETAMVNHLSQRLYRERNVRIALAAHLTEARQALPAAGFYELRTLDQMVLEL
jgi:ribosomal protein S18 acetylase RimI-like enzyme